MIALLARNHIETHDISSMARIRHWLVSDYHAHTWTIRNSIGEGRDETVTFDVKMADGRSLIEHEALCKTAKEFAFWIRAGTYRKIHSAAAHKQYIETIIRICYALTIRRVKSFSDLKSDQVDEITRQSAQGRGGLVSLRALVRARLSAYEKWQDVPQELITNGAFDEDAVGAQLNLPHRWLRADIGKELKSAAARLQGKVQANPDQRQPAKVASYIGNCTGCFDALYALRHFIQAPTLRFRPYPEGPSKRAFDLGSAPTRTEIPPPSLALKLMEESTRFVATQADRIVAEYREIVLASLAGEFKNRLWAIYPQLRRLCCACWVLIATFTARRSSEIKKLKRDCLEGDKVNGWWMRVYISKTQREETLIPVPDIVSLAVNALKSLNADQGEDGDARLIGFYQPFVKKFTQPVRIHEALNAFAKDVGAVDYKDKKGASKVWSWITRQFRRFFAVLYHWRYKGKIEALSHQLRHFSLEVTNDYVTLDPENAAIWNEEVWNFQTSVARDLVEGRSRYAGPMGQRLTRMAALMRQHFSKINIIPERMAAAVIGKMTKDQLVVRVKRWVTCTCPNSKEAAVKAACQRGQQLDDNSIGPNLGGAGPLICPGCPWAMIGEENMDYIDEELEAMTQDVASLNGTLTIFAELQAANVLVLSRFREKLRSSFPNSAVMRRGS